MAPRDTPAILAPPALLWALALLGAWGAEALRPCAFLSFLGLQVRWGIGLGVWAAALAMGGGALWVMSRQHTPAEPWKPSTALVDRGPFRLSRNPIYVALVASLVALAISFDSLWYLLAALVLLVVLDRGVVRAEETYLGERFGAPYAAYRARVRRWL